MKRTPSISMARSLTRYGTPAKGPSGARPATASAARSKTGVTTAFSTGFSASIRSMAAVTSSAALDLPGAHQLGLGGGVEQREFVAHGRIACRTCATWMSPRSADPRHGQPGLGDSAQERLAPGELLVDLFGGAGVEILSARRPW